MTIFPIFISFFSDFFINYFPIFISNFSDFMTIFPILISYFFRFLYQIFPIFLLQFFPIFIPNFSDFLKKFPCKCICKKVLFSTLKMQFVSYNDNFQQLFTVCLFHELFIVSGFIIFTT